MFIATVPNRNSPPAILLRASYRENGKMQESYPGQPLDAARACHRSTATIAQGRATGCPEQASLQIIDSPQRDQVQAVLDVMKRLRIAELIHARACPERDRVMAMIAARVIEPHTKLATVRWWHTATLSSLIGVSECDENDLYAGLDWLLELGRASLPDVQVT